MEAQHRANVRVSEPTIKMRAEFDRQNALVCFSCVHFEQFFSRVEPASDTASSFPREEEEIHLLRKYRAEFTGKRFLESTAYE